MHVYQIEVVLNDATAHLQVVPANAQVAHETGLLSRWRFEPDDVSRSQIGPSWRWARGRDKRYAVVVTSGKSPHPAAGVDAPSWGDEAEVTGQMFSFQLTSAVVREFAGNYG